MRDVFKPLIDWRLWVGFSLALAMVSLTLAGSSSVEGGNLVEKIRGIMVDAYGLALEVAPVLALFALPVHLVNRWRVAESVGAYLIPGLILAPLAFCILVPSLRSSWDLLILAIPLIWLYATPCILVFWVVAVGSRYRGSK